MKENSLKKLEILNFEGPVLVAHKVQDTFVIMDQWKKVVGVLEAADMTNYINGEFSIFDSQGKGWLYTNESDGAKRSPEEVFNFINQR